MANFPVNPLAFLPNGLTIDPGPVDRLVRSHMVVPAEAPLQHDRKVIAETNRFIPIQLREDYRIQVMNLLNESQLFVSRFDDHPLGLGIFTMTETLIADATVGTTFEIDEITTVTFVKHNEARNMRLTPFGRETWIQFLAFPLVY